MSKQTKQEEEQAELPPSWDPQPKPELEPKEQTAEDIAAQQEATEGPGKEEGFGHPELNIRPETSFAKEGEPEAPEGTEPPAEGEDVTPHKRKRR